ncbi:MAG TPA: hydroxymethylglutaryl-CoA reductase, degradative [Saprospiraceae bacterium]|nr:hydroxymethylglutaryl-CoA reductase, degradative [Saprospiraceae bacterium]
MENRKTISGFSKLSKRGKIKWIVENFFRDPELVMKDLISYWHHDEEQQRILDGFSENTISNYHMPFGVAPNFVIDGETYCIPMVIEESSVVAAASSAGKFWMSRGGFNTQVLGTTKIGQVHFKWTGIPARLYYFFPEIQKKLRTEALSVTANMVKRGGGITGIELLDFTDREPDLFQIKVSFETCNSMGANFINTVLEQFASSLKQYFITNDSLTDTEKDVKIIMSILSNYTPECLVRAEVQCPVGELGNFSGGMDAWQFAEKFRMAVKIAHLDPYRATTHNKGIFNGIDAVVLATGNDFRAIEACGHTYASKNGAYQSLSHCTVEDDMFRFWLEIPLAVGTIGGLTSLHPIAKRSLELLGNPGAEKLMRIIAAVGLAQNFAALRSLVTTGIQQGHMRMHLLNVLNHLQASEHEMKEAIHFFSNKVVSFSHVREFLDKLRVG